MAEVSPWRSVRGRLLIIALLPILVLTPILLAITMQRWLMRTDQILTARVASDLTVGRQYLDHLIANTGQKVGAFAASAAFRDMGAQDPVLRAAQTRMGLDFLVLAGGTAEVPQGVLTTGQSGIAILSPQELAALSPDLAARAHIDLVETPGSGPLTRTSEDRGMVVLASIPVDLPAGGRGTLLGGHLLNRNEGFIDRISDLVYPATNPELSAMLEEGLDLGIITLFLDDARISTTLRLPDGNRAVGTRASSEVAEQVLEQGLSWHDTAFVLNGWYISAYEPITGIDGARVGMLYAGIPKAPYTQARLITLAMIGFSFVVVVGLFVPLALRWARGIFRPVEAMGRTIARVEDGDLAARSGPQPGAEEIARLAAHLDKLLGQLEQRDRALRALNEDLNTRVEIRTADLTRANHALEVASRQLVLAEKLATIGEVTAGVAHEINNPLAVISGNLEVIRMVLADHGAEAGTELRLIDDQIGRIGRLVTQMLQFARPEEFGAAAVSTDPVAVIGDLDPLVRHLLARGGVRMEKHLRATRHVRMNPHELQQVLINLIANAVQAMPDGGVIGLTLEDASAADGRPGVLIGLSDTGRGMDETTLSRVFEPFFTRRGADGGTGLGLPICQTLVTRQGGEMTVESHPGQGTRFRIWLPEAVAGAGALG